MRLYIGFVALLLSMLFSFAPVKAQVITEGPDSVRVLTPDTLAATEKGFFLSNLKDLDRPGKAALYSAILPGAGQFYNRAYWKIPIVYATGAVLGYFLIDNHTNYQSYRIALNTRLSEGVASTDEYADHPYLGVSNGATQGSSAVNNLKYRRDYYRRNRDLTVLLSIGAHVLQISEAYVHAHLKEFDVSDDLALRIQPGIIPVAGPANSLSPGLTFTLYTRSK
ncbi:hypothetical protein DXT99_04180 [Pontibacter diazotrophicus]|uniref:DUF5683 domain-containing protein n=1 Tax=Pontibacter diazotrophicus TaxID=1400979 RepID=A0A3D8LG83_9BACT|nr:DUF5683 domain-containing protein [Pontibacter diazotrophicus]RDV16407.1 hypothetical protein DXT99_04180 [Pontibacter diazotrophicus]